MKHLSVLSLTALVLLSGCQTAKRPPLELIIVPDISASIDGESERQMFAAIKDAATHLHRGDTLTIIPITGDADAELQGRILRYELPPVKKREAYDADIRKISVKVGDDLARLEKEAVIHPSLHTDIVGTTRAALKSFSSAPSDKRLIILSDFIQDDEQYCFTSDRRLSEPRSAAELAGKIKREIGGNALSVAVAMGRLRSAEFGRLPPNRRRAIDAFWHRLLEPSTVDPDGTFALQQALSNAPVTR
jgi:hypothetical protein